LTVLWRLVWRISPDKCEEKITNGNISLNIYGEGSSNLGRKGARNLASSIIMQDRRQFSLKKLLVRKKCFFFFKYKYNRFVT